MGGPLGARRGYAAPAERPAQSACTARFRAPDVPPRLKEQSRFMDLTGLLAAPFPVVLEDERDLVAFVETIDARLLERAGMDKYVFRPVVRRNEAETL